MAAWIFDVAAAPPDFIVRYGQADPQQFAHLRLPKGAGPHPVLVFIHGGYYRARYSLDHAEHACIALTEAGFATYSVEYRRLGSGGGFPATFEDVAAATDFLAQIAAEHNLDLQNVVTIGHSAGGHLALWLAARHRLQSSEQLYTPNPLGIKAAVSLAGVNDLIKGYELGLSDSVIKLLLDGTPESRPERYAQTSPMALLPLGVPHWVIHGTEDENLPYSLNEGYVQTANFLGDPVVLITLAGAGHFEVIDPRSKEWSQVVAATRQAASL